MAEDDTDLRAAILRLEAENRRLWSANDELMRDQVAIERNQEKMERRIRVIEEWASRKGDA